MARDRNTPSMPPVGLQSGLAPVDHPQYIPSSPQRLPPPGERPSKRVTDGLLFASALPTTPAMTPAPGVARALIMDPHHYANLTEGVYAAGAAPTGVPFLTEPATRRNLLGLRNTAASGGASIYIGFGRDASTQSWLEIPAATSVLFTDVVPQNDLYAITSAGAVTLAYAYSTIAA